jgi:hypothetical protein
MIDPASVTSPVEYRLEGLRIVLTGNRYPTEPLPPEEPIESLPEQEQELEGNLQNESE